MGGGGLHYYLERPHIADSINSHTSSLLYKIQLGSLLPSADSQHACHQHINYTQTNKRRGREEEREEERKGGREEGKQAG